MDKVKLGNTKSMVSKMGLGCLPFGTILNKEQSFEILDYYVEQGGSFLDTSNNYSFWEEGAKGGESESIVGQWIKERNNRDKIFLATKVGALPPDKQKLMDNINEPDAWTKYTEGLSKETILNSVEDSLRRLNTDYIDLYYAHVDARQNNLEETLEAFDILVKSGKVKHIGCSNYKVWRMIQAKNISRKNGWAEYAAMQTFHTYFQSEKGADTGMADQVGDELMDYVKTNKDLTIVGYSPLLYGAYTRNDKNDDKRIQSFDRIQNTKRKKRLEKVSKESGATINQVVYAWMMQNDVPAVPLVAVSKMEHLKENLDSVNVKLTKEQIDYLNSPLN